MRMFVTVSRPCAASLGLMMIAICCLLLASCNDSRDPVPRADDPLGKDGWLTGDLEEKLETIADQFGGFDQTMIEVGYRYESLYWAGIDGNWKFAKYQAEEMRESIERGLARRPEHADAAQPFLNTALPRLEEAIVKPDRELFRERFDELIVQCNACHAMRDVPFIYVREPKVRRFPWLWQEE